MIFTERYKDIIKTEKEIKEIVKGCEIENNIIKEVRILVTGHFGNTVSVDMLCNGVCPFPLWNSTHNIGYILRALIEIFDKENDGSVNITNLNNTPIRLVFENGCKCIGIGHFMKDRFVLTEDLMKIKE